MPTLTITGGSEVTEGGAAEFTITASEAPLTDLTVNLSVADAASNFVADPDEGVQRVVLAKGATSVTYSVATVDNSGPFADELSGEITVTLKNGTGYKVGTSSLASER